MPERLIGTDCKSVALTGFIGSNPIPSTTKLIHEFLLKKSFEGSKAVEAVYISKQLESFCRDYVTALGVALDRSIRIYRLEYEAGFNEAMHFLSNAGFTSSGRNPFEFHISREDRPRILAEIKQEAELGGIPYNKLSPINQFFVSIPPYVFYCLKKYLPNDPGLREEAERFMSTKGFPRYLQEWVTQFRRQSKVHSGYRNHSGPLHACLDLVSVVVIDCAISVKWSSVKRLTGAISSEVKALVARF